MVSTLSLVAMAFSLAVSVLFPIILAVLVYRQRRFPAWVPLVGALVFLVFQILTRIPLLQLLATMPWYRLMATNLPLIALFLGFTAGLFEEVGRWVGMRLLMSRHLTTADGIAYGIGHGGFEALTLSGLVMINDIAISLMINSGTFMQSLGATLGQSQAQTILNTLVNTPYYLFAVSGVERIMAIIIQIALSLLVLISVRARRPVFLIYAILLHTLLDFGAVVLSAQPNKFLWTELWTFVCAVAGLFFIRWMWTRTEPV